MSKPLPGASLITASVLDHFVRDAATHLSRKAEEDIERRIEDGEPVLMSLAGKPPSHETLTRLDEINVRRLVAGKGMACIRRMHAYKSLDYYLVKWEDPEVASVWSARDPGPSPSESSFERINAIDGSEVVMPMSYWFDEVAVYGFEMVNDRRNKLCGLPPVSIYQYDQWVKRTKGVRK